MAINLNHIDNSILIGTSETVRIASTGKVAIGGYGDPNSILDVRENKDGAETQIRLFNTDNGDTTTQTAALYLSPDSRGTALTGIRAIKDNADFSTNAGRDVALTLNTLQNNSQQERLRISSIGNIGIGSAVPETKLDVRGNINFQNGMLVSNWDSNGASGTNIDHIWHSDASNYGRGGTWNFVSDAAAKVTGNASIQIGFLKSSGGGHLLGDVGIGTTNPNGRLHISSGTANSDCVVIIQSDTDNNDENANPQIWFKQDGDITGGFVGQSSNQLVISNNISNSGGISFRTGTTDNQGTTDPFNGATEKFFITPGGRLVTNAASSVDCGVGGLHLYLGDGARNDYSTSADGLIIEKNGTTGLSIDPGSSGTAAIYFPNESNHSIASITHNNSTGELRIRGEDHIVFSTNGNTERIKIDANGHVNIGGTNEVQLTATNHEILHLHGAITDANIDHAWGLNIDMDDDAGGTTTADRERGCIHCDFHGNNYGGDTSNETRLWNIHSDVEVTGDYDSAVGVYSDLVHSATSGTSTNVWGLYGYVQKNSSGTVNNLYGVYGIAQNTTGSSGTVGDMVGGRFRVNLCAGSGAGTATDIMGVWSNLDNDNEVTQGGGKCFLFYGNYDKTAGLNNPMGVYITTDVPNYFHGKVGIDQTSPTKKLHVVEGDASSDDIIAKFKGGTGSDCKGRIAVIAGYSDTANDSEGHVFLGALRNGSGNQSHMVFETYNGSAVGERMRIKSNGDVRIGAASGSSEGSKTTKIVYRTLAAAQWSTVEIGNIVGSNGACSFRMTINCPNSGWSITKMYDIAAAYNFTTNNWRVVKPTTSTYQYDGDEFELNIKTNAATTYFRLRKTKSTSSRTGDLQVIMDIYGKRESFSSTSSTGTDTAQLEQYEGTPIGAYSDTSNNVGAQMDYNGVQRVKTYQSGTLISDDIGSLTHQPNEFPANNRQLMVYTSTNGQPIGNTACARVLIATDAKQTGAQGYHGSIDFGSSDATAASGAAEFNWRTAAIMCRGDGDTSPSIADGDLQFWTKSASGGMTHRFDIAPNGDLTATDTNGIGNLSDQRLKTNIQDFTYDLNKFKQLKTKTFDWINPEFHREGNQRGFLAQEIETVDPYWNYQFEVSKETAKKDYDLLSDGDENYTIIDHRPGKASKLNGKDAMYVSVIQQLMSKIETLEAKVAALEGS